MTHMQLRVQLEVQLRVRVRVQLQLGQQTLQCGNVLDMHAYSQCCSQLGPLTACQAASQPGLGDALERLECFLPSRIFHIKS